MLWTHYRCPRRKSFDHGQVYRCFFSRMRKVVDHLQKVMQTFFGRGQEERRRSWCEGQWELSQKKNWEKIVSLEVRVSVLASHFPYE